MVTLDHRDEALYLLLSRPLRHSTVQNAIGVGEGARRHLVRHLALELEVQVVSYGSRPLEEQDGSRHGTQGCKTCYAARQPQCTRSKRPGTVYYSLPVRQVHDQTDDGPLAQLIPIFALLRTSSVVGIMTVQHALRVTCLTGCDAATTRSRGDGSTLMTGQTSSQSQRLVPSPGVASVPETRQLYYCETLIWPAPIASPATHLYWQEMSCSGLGFVATHTVRQRRQRLRQSLRPIPREPERWVYHVDVTCMIGQL